MVARTLRLVSVLSLSCVLAFSQAPATLGKVEGQVVYAPFWTLEPGWHTHFGVRNSLADKSVTVTPILRLSNGREIPLTARTIGPNQAIEVDVEQELTKLAPGVVQKVGAYGSVAFKFSGTHTRNIYADSMVSMPGHPIAFHFDAVMQDTQFAAGSQESIWWLPRDSASEILVVSNNGVRAVLGWVELYGPDGTAWRKRLTFGSGETMKLDVRELVRSAKLEGTIGGLRLTLDREGGFIQVAHLVYDELGGYSAILKPFDRGAPAEVDDRQYLAAMVALGNSDPALSLPEGTSLASELMIRNASGKTLDVTLSASWRAGANWGVADLGTVQLGSNETRIVSLNKFQESELIPRGAHWASVRLKYRGARGDLVAMNASHDPTYRYLLQSPFTDALSFSWKGGMWTVDATHNSLITAGNAGDKPARVKATLQHASGAFELPERTLQPGESLWLNVRELIQNQVLDREGNTIPPGITSGVYEFDQVDDDMVGSLYEGKLILDSTFGHAIYGCANCCGYYAGDLAPNPFGIGVGFTGQDRIYVENGCTGAITERTTYGFSWLTGNSTIAGINSSGLVSAFTPGQTTSRAFINLRTPEVWNCPQQQQEVGNTVAATCAVPINFRKELAAALPDGTLSIRYAWDSSTGVRADLAGCVIAELVEYPGSYGTYTWPRPPFGSQTPNPDSHSGNGANGIFLDKHYPPTSWVTPYIAASFQASQLYQYVCPCANGGNQVHLANYTITRAVTRNTDGTYKYTVTKGADSATLNPLP